MEKTYFTITGTYFYHGKDFFEKDMAVTIIVPHELQNQLPLFCFICCRSFVLSEL